MDPREEMKDQNLEAQEELEKELGLSNEEEREEGSEKEEEKGDEGKKEEKGAAEQGDKGEEGKDELPEKKEDLIDDKEYDLGDMGKFKGSELKDLLDKGKDYTKKTQELSEKESKVKELQNWANVVKGDKRAIDVLIKFSEKLMDDKGKYNGELLERMQAALDNKVEQSKEGLDARKVELEKELDELDPDSPMYKIVKGSLDQIKQLKTRLDTAEAQAKEAQDKRVEQEYQNQVKHAQQVYRTTLDGLTDPEKEDSLKFEDESGKKIWQSLVSSYMKDNPKEYKDEEDFVNTLTDVGKACHKTISQFSEAVVAKYLKSKGKTDEGSGEEKAKAANKGSESVVVEGGQDALEAAVAGALREMSG
jgi:hypothetical protein